MSSKPYPHSRDDCDSCRRYDADMAVDVLPDEATGDTGSREGRWCSRCAGPLLTRLVLTGRTPMVSPPDAPLDLDELAAAEEWRRTTGLGPTSWTTEFAVEVLRDSTDAGARLVRALVDAGGTATADQLREVTGVQKLHSMGQSVNQAVRRRWRGPLPNGERLYVVRSHPAPGRPRESKVHSYELLPAGQVTIWAEALARLGH